MATPLAYNVWLELIETSVFTRQITALLNDDQYRRLQVELVANPNAGALIKGGCGIRKVRVGVEKFASASEGEERVAVPASSTTGPYGRTQYCCSSHTRKMLRMI